ncbi:MAG: retaining beta-glycosidase [Phycisphaerales bacterium]|nr:retaining beta-glycosidase [Phycisphaerales bacterium]
MNRCVLCIVLSVTFVATVAEAREKWTPEQAQAWGKSEPWLVGCNFSPSNAANQLEMWQADTFDLKTIDRELGWAQGLGFNSVRVFLHDLLWTQDSEGFLKRMDQFLEVADRHHIRVDFVLFDSVWDPHPQMGKQREPRKGIHNSRWVQSPGVDILTQSPEVWDAKLKPYVVGVVSRFKDDKRVVFWETINEPDNTNRNSYGGQEPPDKPEIARKLMVKVFAWMREAGASQPVTSGVWLGNWGDEAKLSPMERAQLGESDVISFHSYDNLEGIKPCIEHLRRYGRPVLCTEYMARPRGSTFDPILGYLKEQKVAAYNWGFVAGKTNTIYAWDTWQKPAEAEPQVWFHDIFRQDGTPFDAKEAEYIRKVTGVK